MRASTCGAWYPTCTGILPDRSAAGFLEPFQRGSVDLNELFRVLWRRKMLLLGTLVLVMVLAAGSLAVQQRIYEAESTVVIAPTVREQNPIGIFEAIDVITPVYAQAILSRDTQVLAQSKLTDEISTIGVRTF